MALKRFGNLLIDPDLVEVACVYPAEDVDDDKGSEGGFIMYQGERHIPAAPDDVKLLMDYIEKRK